jgi:hypothetical protein
MAFAVLEIGVRLWLSPGARAALPHVGFDEQQQNRLRWLERWAAGPGRGADAELRFDRPDALLGWVPVPDADRRSRQPGSYDVRVHTTTDGIRGSAPASRARVPGRTRIAVFGCSQTFGAEVEDDETYSARLQALLRDVEVLNFGVHGYGTDQMLLRYERDGVPYQPDVVVIGFAYYHLERNLDDFRFFAKPRFVLDDGGALRLTGVPVPTPETYRTRTPRPRPSALLDASVALRWGWHVVTRYRASLLYRPDSAAWPVSRALFARFARDAQEHGARVVLLNLEEDAPEIEPGLAQIAREDGDVFANAGPVLRDVRRAGTRLRVRRNPHWGAGGHAIIAQALARAACDSGIVPKAACPAGADAAPAPTPSTTDGTRPANPAQTMPVDRERPS